MMLNGKNVVISCPNRNLKPIINKCLQEIQDSDEFSDARKFAKEILELINTQSVKGDLA